MAIDMPLTVEAVVIYLGIVLAGCAVVSIADSFVAREIGARLRIAGARAIFTQVGWVAGCKLVASHYRQSQALPSPVMHSRSTSPSVSSPSTGCHPAGWQGSATVCPGH